MRSCDGGKHRTFTVEKKTLKYDFKKYYDYFFYLLK